jgi:hypothetical protein
MGECSLDFSSRKESLRRLFEDAVRGSFSLVLSRRMVRTENDTGSKRKGNGASKEGRGGKELLGGVRNGMAVEVGWRRE